jgi:hypothetical protein
MSSNPTLSGIITYEGTPVIPQTPSAQLFRKLNTLRPAFFTIKREKQKDTLDLEWIQEEERLRNANELLQKQVLETVSIRFFFVDTESTIIRDKSYQLPLDVSNTISILSKNALLQCIHKAKRELNQDQDAGSTVSFSLMDVLVWNVDVETNFLQQYAETFPPEWIGEDFVKGSLFDDIIFLPSLCIFHSLQSVYVFLRVDARTPPPPVVFHNKKYTRRRM